MRRRFLALVGLLYLAAPSASAAPPFPLHSAGVSVAADGTVRHAGAALGRLALPRCPCRLRVVRPTVQGHPLLHVVVEGQGPSRAELLYLLDASPERLFGDTTGPVGVDREWSRHLRVDARGVLLYQSREGVTRCDGVPVQLFPRLYDFATRRFRPVTIRPRLEGLPELRAVPERPPEAHGEPVNTFRFVAASTQLGDGRSAEQLVAPVELSDGRAETAWSEDLGDRGRGQFLTARRPSSPYALRALRLLPGDARDLRAFAAANRLQRVLLLLSPTERYRIVFPKDPLAAGGTRPHFVVLPRPTAATCATLLVEETYPGRLARAPGAGRTAISEVSFFTELEQKGGLAQVARDLAGSSAAHRDEALRVLATLGDRGVPLLGAALETARGEELRRLASVLGHLGRPAAAEPLVRALPRLPSAARREVLEQLAALGTAAVGPLTALVEDEAQPAHLRAEAAQPLGRLGGDATRQLLLRLAGRGPAVLRAAVTEGLAANRSGELALALLAAALAAPDGPRRADLVLAATRASPPDADGAVATRALATLWARSASFEVRYRILHALGRCDPLAPESLLRSAARDRDPVLRWTAVEQLARRRSAPVEPLLRAALSDPDPRVRAAAASGLGTRAPAREAGPALAALLDRERWSFVLRAVAEALGTQCGSAGAAALRRRMERGPPGLDELALSSWARCGASSVHDELLALARRRDLRPPVRARALALLPNAAAVARRDALLRLFRELRAEAPHSDAAEQVAGSAAAALGRAGGSDAAHALTDTLALDPHDALRTAAAHALGLLCDASSLDTLRRAARNDSAGPVRAAARTALRRCPR
ncbi:MAG: HEAT repeat domain-containing protein [Deltaproteobacteria bacterium]|nr:HEAT repeat domain-containing protein [Deltaproteobacteria bacterium]